MENSIIPGMMFIICLYVIIHNNKAHNRLIKQLLASHNEKLKELEQILEETTKCALEVAIQNYLHTEDYEKATKARDLLKRINHHES